MSTERLFNELRDEIATVLPARMPKGLVDPARNIYPIPLDTKLLSKVFEIAITPTVRGFAERHRLELLEAETQIQYPDYSLHGKALGTSKWVALDVKSSYREDDQTISGFTLGTFRGSLRDTDSTQYSRLPYKEYENHWVLCIIYSRNPIDLTRTYPIEKIGAVPDVVADVEVHVHEKYKIAVDRPGSGNTANIGSVVRLLDIRNGSGPFAGYGQGVFEDYWRNYMRREDAQRGGLEAPPYKDLPSYFRWKKKNRS